MSSSQSSLQVFKRYICIYKEQKGPVMHQQYFFLKQTCLKYEEIINKGKMGKDE